MGNYLFFLRSYWNKPIIIWRLGTPEIGKVKKACCVYNFLHTNYFDRFNNIVMQL
jgi:hypothetical protein